MNTFIKEKKEFKAIALILVFAMILTLMTPLANRVYAADNQIDFSYLTSDTQMASETEAVFVSKIDSNKREQNFNANWRFYLGDLNGAESKNFNDSAWQNLNLPHDYSADLEYTKSGEGESGYKLGGTGWYRKSFKLDPSASEKRVSIDFDGVYMNATVYVNGNKLGFHPYGYSPFSFDITDYVEFGKENVIAVKVEHNIPSSRWYSGSGIYRDVNLVLTDQVKVAYRGIKVETPNLAIEKGGKVTTNINSELVNTSKADKKIKVKHTIFKKGEEVSKAIGTVVSRETLIKAGNTVKIDSVIKANNPELWSIENPNLYIVRTELLEGEKVLDTVDTVTGYRYFNFDKNKGFSLNGEAMKLKGVCMHHDNGALGSEEYQSAANRKVRILKDMGANSIRVTHNPASQALIDAANEMGILLIEEMFDGWVDHKNGNGNDYASWFETQIDETNQIVGKEANMTWAQYDLKSVIKRGQNSPAIIAWSLGNEIFEGIGGSRNSEYPGISKNLITWANKYDSTRPVTFGDNKLKDGWNVANRVASNIHGADGIVGLNYASGNQYDRVHRNYPNWIMYGSETASAITSRGSYQRTSGGMLKTSDKELTAYDNSAVAWGHVASDAWYEVITRDFVAGEYVWTGFDYLGEPTPWNGTGRVAQGSWPSPKSSYFGIIDLAGMPKDTYYLYQSLWNEDNTTLHILPSWNKDAISMDIAGRVPVVVYSDAASVELFLTGQDGQRKSLGKKTFTEKTTDAGYKYQLYEGEGSSSTSHKNLYLTWDVKYEKGQLEAVAYDKNGNVINDTVGRKLVKTTGDPSKFKLSPDFSEIRANGTDLSYVRIDVTDKDGNIISNANNKIKVTVSGAGELLGLENGEPADHTSPTQGERKAFNGSLMAIVKSTDKSGNINVKVESEGLQAENITLKSKASGEETDKKIGFYVYPKNYYVLKDKTPVLPREIEAHYTDGTVEKVQVNWNDINKEQISELGTFTVEGKTSADDTISANINIIDKIKTLLNASLTTGLGSVPKLPDARPAVMPDGTILKSNFAVDWENVDPAKYNTEGTVIVNGTAVVLGQSINVTCSVRVQKEAIGIGENVGPNAASVTQDIEPSLQSDTIEAIIDGDTSAPLFNGNDGDPNPKIWTNYKASQKGINKANIVFEYATQQVFGEFVVTFTQDGWSARYPDPNTVEFYVSESGNDGDWTKVEATETIGAVNDNIRPYTYKFAPVAGTFVKLSLVNKKEDLPERYPCTGISEVELKTASSKFSKYSSTELESLNVNGKAIDENRIKGDSYKTEARKAEVKATTKENAALTILPEYEGVIRLIMEAEDNSKIKTFEVLLGQSSDKLSPSSDERDIAPTSTKIEVASEQYPEDQKNNAIDGDESTLWHSKWSQRLALEDRWVTLILDEKTKVDALRYLARSGSPNGRVLDYKVEVSDDNQNWTKVAEGTWENKEGWKIAEFEPVEAKYIRLTGLTTAGDSGANRFMSAVELRVRKAIEKIDIANPDNKIEASLEKDIFKLKTIDENTKVEPKVSVTKDGVALREDIDYIVEYLDNDRFGKAKALITGIEDYSGSIELAFTIEKDDAEPEIFSGWKNENGSWYYYDEDGSMVKSGWRFAKIRLSDGRELRNWKYFNKYGINIEKFYNEHGNTHLSQVGPNKEYAKGWYKLGKIWIYGEGSWGKLVKKGWRFLEVKQNDGSKVRNWKYFDENGYSVNKMWTDKVGSWYSLSGPDRQYVRGWLNLDGNKYFFTSKTGKAATGFRKFGPNYRYFREDGVMLTGWQTIGSSKYYFTEDSGVRLAGRQYISGKWYTFSPDGKLR